MEHNKRQILPDDILVEIAEYDWRVYNAIVRCNKALNKRLRCARYRTQGALGNYIKHVQWRQDAATIDPNEIARYHRNIYV
ncbi:hypothetical protein D5b_00481 [Faustovirus]|nr:hypothetical protein D5b_00481 [Faustovirus]AMN84438.1 hypothetical protein D6_00027 [Faustovirus]AMP44420.1 hypothetical protein PRJ_Dakar_00469 [Faustovirus]